MGSIKIECQKCGHRNDLGRVFCVGCGVKLDMRATSAHDLKADREGFPSWIRPLVTTLLLIAVLAVIGLALWPAPLPKVFFDKSGSVQVPMKAKAILTALSYNRNVTMSMTEGELNGYLTDRARSKKLEALAIDLKPGSFDLYLAESARLPVSNVQWAAKMRIPLSMHLRGSFQGGTLSVDQVHVGHLALPGGAGNMVTTRFAGLFVDILREQRFVSSLKSVALEEDRADLMLGP